MLQRVQEIEQKLAYHETTSSNATTLPLEDLAALGTNLEHVWFAPGTDAKLKKRIVRTVMRSSHHLQTIEQMRHSIHVKIRGHRHTAMRTKVDRHDRR